MLHNECLQTSKSLVYTSCEPFLYMKWIQFSKEECKVAHVGRTHHLFSAGQETIKWVEVLQKKILDLEWMTNSA